MSKIFARKIISTVNTENVYTIDSVPNLWKKATLEELAIQGFDGYGNPKISD